MQETHPTNEKAPSQDRALPATKLLRCDDFSLRNDAYIATTEGAFNLELDHAFHFREQGVIFAHTNAVASVELGTALTHDDVAWNDSLAAIHLHAKAFGF
ncbi:hypothetical protein PLUA15_500084 [Pseudomonas lundensis]|uniref:Uncharacterized protein n=1 Tax=Pseudomonas lundensis TaxID=86185 RepID=A0AAX2HBK8_9PSED|nr:hypothetical protein PLUA15_500084 [Pseudomonas lundensis]